MTHDLSWLLRALDQPEIPPWAAGQLPALRSLLTEAVIVEPPGQRLLMRGDLPVGRVLPFGSVVLYLPAGSPTLRHRVIEVDRNGHVTLAVQRAPHGEFQRAWVRSVDGAAVGILPHGPDGAEHPLWGASDRIVRLGHAADAELLTVCAAVDWDHIGAIPPLADPTRLPPGAGTSLLNLLAALVADQGRGPLRYRGPYPTEQLFWALVESFRFAPTAPDPIGAFTEGAEAAFAHGKRREAPLDWTAAPHERLFLDGGIYVQLRDGVEKVHWAGRTYYRAGWQGLRRHEHRVIRAIATPAGGLRFVASIEALGRPLEDHLTLDATGALLDRHLVPSEVEPFPDTPFGRAWREALEALLPLEATPLLATAIAAVWPTIELVWGTAPGDLIETQGATLRVSIALARAFLTERATRPVQTRRSLAHRLVREVVALAGPPVRRIAAAWLEAEPRARQEALLAAAERLDRRAAAIRGAEPLERLLDALEVGDALPPYPPVQR